MKKSIFSAIASFMRGAFAHKNEPIMPEEASEASRAIAHIHKPGRGAYFKNNRKRTRGRNFQYVNMPDGHTKIIRHESAQ